MRAKSHFLLASTLVLASLSACSISTERAPWSRGGASPKGSGAAAPLAAVDPADPLVGQWSDGYNSLTFRAGSPLGTFSEIAAPCWANPSYASGIYNVTAPGTYSVTYTYGSDNDCGYPPPSGCTVTFVDASQNSINFACVWEGVPSSETFYRQGVTAPPPAAPAPVQPPPNGFFWLTNYGGYYTGDDNHYCWVTSPSMWLAMGGPSGGQSGVENYASIPSGMTFDGECQQGASALGKYVFWVTQNQPYTGGYYSYGNNHYCWIPNQNVWAALGGPASGATGATNFPDLPPQMTFDGECEHGASALGPYLFWIPGEGQGSGGFYSYGNDQFCYVTTPAMWTQMGGPATGSSGVHNFQKVPASMFNDGDCTGSTVYPASHLAVWNVSQASGGFSVDPSSGKVTSTIGAGWSVVGQGDFLASGQAAVLLQDGQQLAIQYLTENGSQIMVSPVSGNVSPALGAGWSVVGQGDFLNLGKTGILLQNGQQLAIWYLAANGTQITASSVNGMIGPALDAGWSVVGVGDFLDLGKAGILLQNGQQLAIWYLEQNGTQIVVSPVNGNVSAALDAGWSVAGRGDFLGLGKTGILVQNGQQLAIWYLAQNGAQIVVSTVNGNITSVLDPGWSVVGEGDFLNLGKAGILIQNGQQLAIWYVAVNGTQIAVSAVNGDISTALGAGWSVAGQGDFLHLGKPGILLRAH